MANRLGDISKQMGAAAETYNASFVVLLGGRYSGLDVCVSGGMACVPVAWLAADCSPLSCLLETTSMKMVYRARTLAWMDNGIPLIGMCSRAQLSKRSVGSLPLAVPRRRGLTWGLVLRR